MCCPIDGRYKLEKAMSGLECGVSHRSVNQSASTEGDFQYEIKAL